MAKPQRVPLQFTLDVLESCIPRTEAKLSGRGWRKMSLAFSTMSNAKPLNNTSTETIFGILSNIILAKHIRQGPTTWDCEVNSISIYENWNVIKRCFPDAKHVRNIAVHYHGDSSSYVLGRHHNYEGIEFWALWLRKWFLQSEINTETFYETVY